MTPRERASSNASPGHPGLLAADLAAGAALAFFGILKAYALGPALSDENIYFYMCHRIAEGALPYRDFFFAHPPLHLVPGALVMSLFGFSLPAAKAIPAAAAALAGLAVYRAGRRAGPLQGLLALCLFLFAYDMLRASSHYTGASEATALLAWGMERALAARPRAAGILAAAAGMTAFYAVPAGAALGVWILLREGGKPRPAVRFAAAYAAVFLGTNLLFAALFRSGYWDPVFRYHFMKPPGGAGNLASVLRAVARENAWLVWSFPAALVALAFLRGRSRERRRRGSLPQRVSERLADPARGPALAGLIIVALHLGFFTLLTRVYTFYVLPAYPGLALAGGAAYAGAVRAAAGPLGRRGRRAPVAPALLGLALLAAPLAIPSLFPPRGVDAEEGEVLRTYTWQGSPLPGWMDAAVRTLIWKADRVQGGWSLAPTRYLWHESRRFTAPGSLARRIQELTPAGGTLFGDSTSAPLAALLAGRRLARDHADTNSMRYRSGITPPREAIASLEEDPPAAVVASRRRGFFLVPEMQDWVASRYRLAESFRDPIYGTYDLYLRKEDPAALP